MSSFRRREALKYSLFSCAALLSGCYLGDDGSESTSTEPSAAPPSPAPPPSPSPPFAGASNVWNINPWLMFPAGTNFLLDLSITLPSGVTRGGLFAIEATGASLPSGMTLSSAGLLAVGGAAVVNVSGVIFNYTPPGG